MSYGARSPGECSANRVAAPVGTYGRERLSCGEVGQGRARLKAAWSSWLRNKQGRDARAIGHG